MFLNCSLVRERSEIIREGGLQMIGEGHHFCALKKGGLQFFSAVT